MYNPLSEGRRWRPILYRQPAGVQDVALTFDDGPHPETTPAILSVLDLHGAKAAFFFSGIRAAAHPNLVAETVKAGHAVYGHGWEHVDLERASDQVILSAMQRTEVLLREFRPTPDVYLIRLPYNAGFRRRRIHAVATRFHPDARFAWWSITTQDWLLARGCTDRADLALRMADMGHELDTLESLPGAIMLMHEMPFGAEGPLAACIATELLQEIFAALPRRGLTVGPIRLESKRFGCFCTWHPGADRPIKSLSRGLQDHLARRLWRKLPISRIT